jgi:hypothetical protein
MQTTQKKSAEVFVLLIRLFSQRREKEKNRRRPSSPAHGKDEDAGDPEGRRRSGKVAFRVRIPTDRIIRDSISFRDRKENKKKSQHLTALHLFPILFCPLFLCFVLFVVMHLR